MSLLWGQRGDYWEPEGGERREWRDLQPGDLIQLRRKIWRVTAEVRAVPVIDWDEHDREYFRTHCGPWDGKSIRRKANNVTSEEDWALRPVYLIVLPARSGRRVHKKVRPYVQPQVYVLPAHYPVCAECGEPYPCPEIGINREVRKNSAEMERLAAIMPGCCWACGEPVTGRQASAVFEGENLLLPCGPPPVFHLRRGSGCRAAAMKYEQQWVPAAGGRLWRLQCSGRVTRHVDGEECDRPECPGVRVYHDERSAHVITEGGVAIRWAVKCTRCRDAVERGEGLPVLAVPENFPEDKEGSS